MIVVRHFRMSLGRSTVERALQHVWRCRVTYYIAVVTTLTLALILGR